MKKMLVLLGVLFIVLSLTAVFSAPLANAGNTPRTSLGSCMGSWDVEIGSPPPTTNGGALWCQTLANFYS